MDLDQQKQVASWMKDLDCWVNRDPLSERLDVYSETWPRSGMMRNGEVFLRPTLGPATDENGCSFARGGKNLPTVTTSEGRAGTWQTTKRRKYQPYVVNACADVHPDYWGEYQEAIDMSVAVHGPHPDAVLPGRTGGPQLQAAFTEWMMMMEPGWVTDTPGVPRERAMHIHGNSVVEPQAAYALKEMAPCPACSLLHKDQGMCLL